MPDLHGNPSFFEFSRGGGNRGRSAARAGVLEGGTSGAPRAGRTGVAARAANAGGGGGFARRGHRGGCHVLRVGLGDAASAGFTLLLASAGWAIHRWLAPAR